MLYLIAGHGAGDPGAVGNGYTEAERVRALCAEIKRLGGNKVVYLEPNRNWYKDEGINSLSIAKEDCLLECHMDSGVTTAKGGHVIIYKGFKSDIYDNALADMLRDILPGRSEMIVPRSDLANPHRAADRGINYRLVEFGFITNANDVATFNNRLTEIANRVLNCFNIKAKKEDPQPTQTRYRVHVQNIGWQDWRNSGEMAGTEGQALRLEAIQIDAPFEVTAKAHIQDIGWKDYGKINKDTVIGTVGESKRLECLCLKGNFKYRVHLENYGWTAWTKADGIATLGTVGQALRIEAIQFEEL